jgi:hypothetical protein
MSHGAAHEAEANEADGGLRQERLRRCSYFDELLKAIVTLEERAEQFAASGGKL